VVKCYYLFICLFVYLFFYFLFFFIVFCFLTSYSGNEDLVKYLIELGTDINKENENERTLLFIVYL